MIAVHFSLSEGDNGVYFDVRRTLRVRCVWLQLVLWEIAGAAVFRSLPTLTRESTSLTSVHGNTFFIARQTSSYEVFQILPAPYTYHHVGFQRKREWRRSMLGVSATV